VSFAAGKTGHAAFEATHATDHGLTLRTAVGVFARESTGGEIEGMTAILARNSEVPAGGFPLGSVGLDPLFAGPLDGNEVGEFVEKGISQFLLVLSFGQALEPGVQFNPVVPGEGSAGCGAHPGIPIYDDGGGEDGEPQLADEVPGDEGQGGIAPCGRVMVGFCVVACRLGGFCLE